MLKLVSLRGKVATVQYEASEKDIPELFDFNPAQQRYTLVRETSFVTDKAKTDVVKHIESYKDASIINTLSHTPRDKSYRLVMYDGLPVIDDFGFYVYIKSTIAWSKGKTDVDLRFNANIYPYKLLEGDLTFLFK